MHCAIWIFCYGSLSFFRKRRRVHSKKRVEQVWRCVTEKIHRRPNSVSYHFLFILDTCTMVVVLCIVSIILHVHIKKKSCRAYHIFKESNYEKFMEQSWHFHIYFCVVNHRDSCVLSELWKSWNATGSKHAWKAYLYNLMDW